MAKSKSTPKAETSATSSASTSVSDPTLELQEDPSNPGRFVKSKKQNQAFLAHHKWKEAQRAKGITQPEPISVILLLKWFLFTIITSLALGHFITGDVLFGYQGKWRNIRRWVPVRQRVFTPPELALYNGRDTNRPTYLAILGNVYDVTAGGETYRQGGAYDFFAGRDASRAFTTGCFKTHLTHDLRGLSDSEVEQIRVWNSFFANHPKYFQVGTVKLPKIDADSPIPEPCT